MPPLKNSRHEKFALALFKGMSQKDALVEAGYKQSRIRSTASRLATKSNILTRIRELHQEAQTEAVMDVQERKERLSEIARARLSDFIEVEEDGSIGKVDIDTGHSAALQEVVVTEFVGGKGHEAGEKATRVKLHDPVKSIAELNRMEHIYELPATIIQDIKVLVVREADTESHAMLERRTETEPPVSPSEAEENTTEQ